MNSAILLHEQTRSHILKAVDSSVQAFLLSGPEGAGKLHTARYFAARKLGLNSPALLHNHPYFKLISPDLEKKSIIIDQIRDLQKFLRLKTPGTAHVRRAVVLEDAHTMTDEAQNALLKALEEPPADTIVVLTAPKTLLLRETIYSRVQQIQVLPPPKEKVLEYFGNDFDKPEIEKALLMSGGSTGLMHSLLHQENHALLDQVNVVKTILGESVFSRLLRVEEISKQKESLPVFLQACKLICSTALHKAATKPDERSLKQWHRRIELVYETEAALPRNPNMKLLLTNLFLNL